MPELDRVTFAPDILGGRACIRGMRISVSLIVNLVADGMTAPQIVSEYPGSRGGGRRTGSEVRGVGCESMSGRASYW